MIDKEKTNKECGKNLKKEVRKPKKRREKTKKQKKRKKKETMSKKERQKGTDQGRLKSCKPCFKDVHSCIYALCIKLNLIPEPSWGNPTK